MIEACSAYQPITSRRTILLMRTQIHIDPKLMSAALELTGARTKRQVVDEALRLLVRIKRQESLRALRGKVAWEGDLERSRRD